MLSVSVFFVRDPILFSSFIHTQKRNPQTNLKDADAVSVHSLRTSMGKSCASRCG